MVKEVKDRIKQIGLIYKYMPLDENGLECILRGYVIEEENGWVVSENLDGSMEKLHKLQRVKHPS